MPKQFKKVEDFSGGSNGYSDPQNIKDNELAQSSGFKSERGELIALGDMKAAYSLGSHTAAGENISIEPGYGLFTFSHDYDKDGDLAATDYYVIQNAHQFNIYDNTDNAWRDNQVTVGTDSSANPMASIKPCFFFVDGALRISPGNFSSVDSGEDSTAIGAINADTLLGDMGSAMTVRYGTTGTTVRVAKGDIVNIDNNEFIVIFLTFNSGGHDHHYFQRNITMSVNNLPATASQINVIPDAKWHGIVDRRAFNYVTSIGTFREWFSCPMSPRPPTDQSFNEDDIDMTVYPFQVAIDDDDLAAADSRASNIMTIGIESTIAGDGNGIWGMTIRLYISALYDDSMQESQPKRIRMDDVVIANGKEFAVIVACQYSHDGTNYRFHKRCVGARLYYEDTIDEPGVLYQLLDIDFENGCKKAAETKWTSWQARTVNKEAICPNTTGATASSRTGANAFVWVVPPKVLTYEINTGYAPNTIIHARYKTAVVANRRLYVGNVAQGGKVYGDRMLYSPVNKFDILPEVNAIDVTTGDGDEIVKLETFADRLLQFKKRTLYIINIGGAVEFLESQHSNMGVENPSQTCKTEYGIAWVNKFGVYLYDGQKITEITRGKLKTVDTTDRARGLNVVENKIPLIGYHALNKWIVVHIASDPSGSFESEAWIYDFKNGSWTWSQEFTNQTTADPPVAVADYKTNMINTADNELVFAAGTNSSNTPDFFKLQASTNAITTDKLFLLTKDFTLEVPSVKKNVYGVFVTYSAAASTAIQADLIYKTSSGSTTVAMTSASALYHDTNGFASTSNARATVELTPSSAISNAYSFQLKLSNDAATYQSADNFKLYNISFRYRTKGVH